MHWAAQNGSLEICRLLIRNGAKVNCKNDHLVTPLMMAVSNNHFSLVEYFLSKNADLAARSIRGDSGKSQKTIFNIFIRSSRQII